MDSTSAARERSRSPRTPSCRGEETEPQMDVTPIDVLQWKLVPKGKNSYNQPILNFVGTDGKTPTKTLLHPDPMMCPSITFSLDARRKEFIPDFVNNPNTQKIGTLDLVLSLNCDEHVNLFETLNKEFQERALTDQKQIFGPKCNYSADQLSILLLPVLKSSDKYSPTIKAKLTLTGPSFLLTRIKIIKDGQKHEGTGWTFLESHLTANGFQRWRCACKLKFSSIKLFAGGSKATLGIDAEEILIFNDESETDEAGQNTLDVLMSKVMKK